MEVEEDIRTADEKIEAVMHGSIWKRLIFMFLAIIVTLVGFYFIVMSATFYHEHVHKAIFDNYDIPSTITYNWFFFIDFKDEAIGYTSPDPTKYAENCNDSCKLANSMNEVVGYHFNALMTMLIVMIFIIIFIMFLKSSLDPSGVKVYHLKKIYNVQSLD